jgi:hypothetical protein
MFLSVNGATYLSSPDAAFQERMPWAPANDAKSGYFAFQSWQQPLRAKINDAPE